MSSGVDDTDGPLSWRTVGYHARSAFAVLLSLAVLIGGGWFVYAKASEFYLSWRTADDYIGEGKDPVSVTVPPGATLTQIGDLLVEAGVVKTTKAFRNAAEDEPRSAALQSGRYSLRTELPAAKALELMLDPANVQVIKITITEGRTIGQQWTIISKASGVDREALRTALNTMDRDLPEWAGQQVEGFMFPDTYQVAEPLEPEQLFTAQMQQFSKVAKDMDLEGKAKALGITPLELVTVASIIEKEAARESDRALVASVIYNRLAQGMKLQFDSTVHYAVGATNRVTTTAEDRAVDSPYNTYRNEGLPPGAISNPGRAALEAAAAPASTDYLYFTAVNLDTGETLFAEDADGHEKNVKLFQQWCQANPGRCT